MITFGFSHLTLLLALSVGRTISQEDSSRVLASPSYIEPLWWPRISASFTGIEKLEQCRRRSQPPVNGTKCAKSKTCYFGTQVCSIQGAHPTTKCVCSGNKEKKEWMCQPELCPTSSSSSSTTSSPILTPPPTSLLTSPPTSLLTSPPTSLLTSPPTSLLSPPLSPSTGCDANGLTTHLNNDPLCPVPGPLDSGFSTDASGCVPALFGKTCSYGTEKCCGSCFANYKSMCDSSGQWMTFLTDSCMFPSCRVKEWTGVQGKTCVEVRSIILKEYPGMIVVCLKETDTFPTDDDQARYLVITDANGLVTKVIFNNNLDSPSQIQEAVMISSCPVVSPLVSNQTVCQASSQQGPCNFQYSSTIPGGVCTNNDKCTCVNDKWTCEAEIGCVSSNPPFIIGCPGVSPLVNNVTACQASNQEQPCNFQYSSTIPGGVCTNTDRCSCVNDKWTCEAEIGCVSSNPPFIIGCPEVSPLVNNVTACQASNQEQPCTFQYSSTIPGGVCTNKDNCTCVKDKWACEAEIGCVSSNPPSISVGNGE